MVGERLAELRKDAGMTQMRLGELLGLSKYTISAYELNKIEPSDTTKVQMARLFDVTVDYLVGNSNHPNHYILHQNSVMMPKDMPQQARQEVKNFLDYLVYKYLEQEERVKSNG